MIALLAHHVQYANQDDGIGLIVLGALAVLAYRSSRKGK